MRRFTTITPMKTMTKIVTQLTGCDMSFQLSTGTPAVDFLDAGKNGFQDHKAANGHEENCQPICRRPANNGAFHDIRLCLQGR